MSQKKEPEKKETVKKPTVPTDAEVYVKLAKERATPSGKVMQELTQNKEQELERTMATIKLEQVQAELEEMRKRRSNISVSQQQAESIATQLFKDKSPEEISQILSSLTPEMINNMQLLAHAVDTNPTTLLLRQPQQTQQPKSDSTTELLLKLIVEQNNKKTDDLITVIKLVKELQGPQTPQQPSENPWKLVMEYNKPLLDQLRNKDKEVYDARLKEIEAKMPGDLSEQIKYVKEMAPILGLTSGQTNELDLRLEEMRENREIDMKRLDWEQKKWEMESEADMNKWEQIGKILQGPLGNVVRDLGSAGADRVRGQKTAPIPTGTPRAVQTQCPNCSKSIYVDAGAETAICGSCGAVLQKQGGAPEPQPVATPVATPVAQPEVAQPEENEEEEENGHNATEGSGEENNQQ